MKKTLSSLFTIFCLLSMLSLLECKISVNASPRTWTVDDDGPADFSKIQDAINAAASGDTIFVHKGTYYENVVVNKTVSLIGEDTDSTIIDGNGVGRVVSITGRNVTVQGLTIRNSGSSLYDSGILIAHSDGNNVSRNTVSNNNDGIYLLDSSNNLISSNTVSDNNYNGIVLSYSTRNAISNNTVSNNYWGISLYYYSGNNLISSNTVSDNHFGIYPALYSNDNTIYHNNFNNFEKNVEIDSMNAWDYEGEGNYWSDYKGQDLNRDGLGDAPYGMNVHNQDNHPLMGIFSNFIVTLERKTYSATVISNSTVSIFRFEIGNETGNKIVRFNVTGENGTAGFCRVTIPTKLMKYPLIVLIDSEEIIPTLLDASNKTYIYLYFTYFHKNQTVTMIYSEALYLYYELFDRYLELQNELYNLNETYYELLNSYLELQTEVYNLNITYYDLLGELYNLNATYYDLLNNYLELQAELYDLNATYYDLLNSHLKLQTELYNLNVTYYDLLNSHLNLQAELYNLNITYYNLLGDLYNLNETYNDLLNNYNILSGNYSQLKRNLDELNAAYQKHLNDYSEQLQNIRGLIYIFAAITAIFIITTIYLSKRAHTGITTKTKRIEDEKGG